jgi:proteasome assembly chaperone 2
MILRQPVISTANIGQLAVDLLIASLSLHRVGVFDARDLVPVVGGREDGELGVTTPLERTRSRFRIYVAKC